MAYLPPLESDSEPTQVQAAQAFVAAPGSPTTALDVVGYRSVDFIITLTTMASVTELEITAHAAAVAGNPGGGDFFDIMTEKEDANTAGLFTMNVYKVKMPSLSASNNGQKRVISVPVKGTKMSIQVTATQGAVANSSYQVHAVRRV